MNFKGDMISFQTYFTIRAFLLIFSLFFSEWILWMMYEWMMLYYNFVFRTAALENVSNFIQIINDEFDKQTKVNRK